MLWHNYNYQSWKLRNCAFVDFKDEALATQAQSQLNRLRFHGKVLAVEKTGMANPKNNQPSEVQTVKDSSGPPASLLKDSSLNSKNLVSGGEPVAARLGVDYPFPPHLEYEYPPPDGNILTNIVNALIAVPRFYTQVLHLMNKMNIPAPFRMALPTPPLPPPVSAPPPPPPPFPPITAEPPLADLSSDESELESSEEDVDDARVRKRVKRETIVGPAIDKGVAHEAVGLKPVTLVPMIKKKNPVLQIKIAPKSTQKEITDDDISTKELTEPAKEHLEQKPYATSQEIESGKLPPEELLSLPMFKNYAPGNPTTVLYIKNLAKDVVVDDFYFIFGLLFGSVEDVRSGLSIKLMQEGRMRGQAFVTFPSIELAHHALNLVNGYVFKGKPMIIQFGRNPAACKAN